MKFYEELESAIEEVVDSSSEDLDFKNRFKKLIDNYYDRSYATENIEDVINLAHIEENEDI